MTLKENILKDLLNSQNKALSGQKLCEQYHVSRTAIWKAIQALKKEGYQIESTQNKGYQLMQDIDQINATQIQFYLEKEIPIYAFQSIDSTNNFAKKLLIDHASDGTLIVANQQSAGRGRQGHQFYSPANTGLYMTILLKPDGFLSEFLSITLAAGIACCQAIEEVCQMNCQIKWVNDLFIGKKKIGGILTEATSDFESQKIDSILVGIGINCKSSQFPSELKEIAGSLNQDQLNRNQLCASIYQHFMYWKDHLQDPNLIDEYKKRSLLIGKKIIFVENHEKKEGLAYDFNPQGNLIIKKENGQFVTIQSGEVSIKDWY